jgi:ketosteroid isomerase-like protein
MTTVDYTRSVERYFACVREHDLDGLIGLFEADGTLTLPDGRELSGVGAIRVMYTQLFAGTAPSPTPQNILAAPNGVAAEIEARLPDGKVRRTANFFHFSGDGLLTRVSIYARGG